MRSASSNAVSSAAPLGGRQVLRELHAEVDEGRGRGGPGVRPADERHRDDPHELVVDGHRPDGEPPRPARGRTGEETGHGGSLGSAWTRKGTPPHGRRRMVCSDRVVAGLPERPVACGGVRERE